MEEARSQGDKVGAPCRLTVVLTVKNLGLFALSLIEVRKRIKYEK